MKLEPCIKLTYSKFCSHKNKSIFDHGEHVSFGALHEVHFELHNWYCV